MDVSERSVTGTAGRFTHAVVSFKLIPLPDDNGRLVIRFTRIPETYYTFLFGDDIAFVDEDRLEVQCRKDSRS